MKRTPLLPALLVSLLGAGLTGCERKREQALPPGATIDTTRPATHPGPAAPPSPAPSNVGDPGELSENIYDAAKAREWGTATAKLDSLRAVLMSSPAAGGEGTQARVQRLAEAVTARDRTKAMEAGNALTRDFARATAAASNTPVEVVMLDYYGRELEIGAAEGEAGMARLRRAGTEIRSTWDAVRPRVVERGGDAEARGFDALVQRVEQARTPEEHGAVATPLLDEVDRLEAVFRR